jgi:AraC-like DNA-binding protein
MIETFFKVLDHKIPAELQDFVLSVVQGESDSDIKASYPVHPNGLPLLIYVYGVMPIHHINGTSSNPESRLNLAGQVYDADIHIEINGKFGQHGLLFYPTAPYYLFHKPGSYFLNKWRPVSEAWPIADKIPDSKFLETISIAQRTEIFLEFLLRLSANRLPPIEWLDRALRQILKKNGAIAQEELIKNSPIGARHFRRKFKEIIGVSPKYFCKVIQLNTIFELLKSSDSKKLHHLALDCGYYDQAHFINDFNKLIGDSPENFLHGEHAYVQSYLGRRSP